MPFEKLARQLLQDHGVEGTFEVTFFNPDECDSVAEQLEKLGCVVQRDSFRRCLTVTVPEGGLTN